MINNPTERALIARGFDSNFARRLRLEGQTLDRLKRSDEGKLLDLGLSPEQIQTIRREPRPPIPAQNLSKVLFANRWVCCVCRDPARPIVVHHIQDWARSHDHSVSNLAVLCLEHHDETHTIRQLTQNLDPTRVSDLKTTWEAQVIAKDALAIQHGSQLQAENWFYFNHLRLYELALELGTDISRVRGRQAAVDAGICTSSGAISKESHPGSFMYADSDRQIIYLYVVSVLKAILKNAVVRNISDYLDQGLVGHLVVPGDLIFVQGVHNFNTRPLDRHGVEGCRGMRKANGVSVGFMFDLREATSVSAWSLWLRGNSVVGSLLRVQRVERRDGKLHLEATVLAIRSATAELKRRYYEVGIYEAGLPQRREMDIDFGQDD